MNRLAVGKDKIKTTETIGGDKKKCMKTEK